MWLLPSVARRKSRNTIFSRSSVFKDCTYVLVGRIYYPMAPKSQVMQSFVLDQGKIGEAACNAINGTIDIMVKIAVIFSLHNISWCKKG